MIIHRLLLQHWGQHSNLDINFPDSGIISLTGPNNSGKSTLLSAIGWVLAPTGRNRFGDRDDIEDGYSQACVQIEFTLGADEPHPEHHVLSKTITLIEEEGQKGTVTTTITLDGELYTAAAWEEFLSKRFDQPNQFLQIMISPQEEIHALLRTAVSSRNKELRENLGIALPDLWHDTLKDEVEQWANAFAQRAGANERALSDLEVRLQQLHRFNQSYALALKELPPEEAILRELAQLDQTLRHLNTYAEKQSEIGQLTRELTQLNQRKLTLHTQQPGFSQLDFASKKNLYNRLLVAGAHIRLDQALTALTKTATTTEPAFAAFPIPSDLEGKKQLELKLAATRAQTEKAIIEKELIQNQISALKSGIKENFALLELYIPQLDEFSQAALHLTRSPQQLPLRKIALTTIKQQYEQAVTKIKTGIAALETQRDQLKKHATSPSQFSSKPFSGDEAADTLTKIWINRTPQNRCILTGADLSHLKEEHIIERANRFRRLPSVTGNPNLSKQNAPQIQAIEEQITEAKGSLTTTEQARAAFLEQLSLLPPAHNLNWFNLSIEKIGACLKGAQANQQARKQIQDLELALTQNRTATSLAQDRSLKEQLQTQQQSLRTLIELQTTVHHYQSELQKLTNKLTAVDPAAVEKILLQRPNLQDIEQKLSQLEKAIQLEETQIQAIAAIDEKISLLTQSLKNAQSALQTLLKDIPEYIDLKRQSLAEHISILQKQREDSLASLKQLQQIEALLKKTQSELEQALSQHRNLQAETQQLQAEKDDLQAARETADFFNARRAPKALLKAALEEIVQETNSILPETGLEIELSVSSDMDFLVSFQRGEKLITEPARRLGCGLATLVGMCLKMALARILQPGLNFLAFDEPSAQLDPAKKQGFAQFLKTLSGQAITQNQLLVVEHDLAIAQACDFQVRLGAAA